jgi:hypothetical protein
MSKNTHIAPADIFVSGGDPPPVVDLDGLEHLARRHIENLDGLSAYEAYHKGEIERLDAVLVTLRDHQANLPKDARAHDHYGAAKAVIDAELERGLHLEELDRLNVEREEELARQKANADAIKAAKREELVG